MNMLLLSLFVTPVFFPLLVSSSSIIRPVKSRIVTSGISKSRGVDGVIGNRSVQGCCCMGDKEEYYVPSSWEQLPSCSIIPRGGSITSSSLSQLFVTKLRNMIKSALEICERRTPWLTKPLKSFLKIWENIMGIRLCPLSLEEQNKIQRKKSSKKKKTSRNRIKEKVGLNDGGEEEEEKVSISQPQLKKRKENASTGKDNSSSSSMWNYSSKDLKSSNPNHRIQRELKQFITSPPPNLSVKVGKNIRVWLVTMKGANNTIYEGETYRLKITFPDRYPIVPPSAYFLKPTPRHEHVYTNGDICLSLLGKDWRPTMTAQSIAVSILSILSSAKKKSLPMDNSRVAGQKPGMSQENWVYHDDNC